MMIIHPPPDIYDHRWSALRVTEESALAKFGVSPREYSYVVCGVVRVIPSKLDVVLADHIIACHNQHLSSRALSVSAVNYDPQTSIARAT